jgi:hypothetical protein
MGNLATLCLRFILAVASSASAQNLPLHPFSYHEGWEADGPQLVEWAKNGDSTVNFAGPTDEQAFEGKRSYKFDVTLHGGSYHYFGVPLRVPCSGKLKLSARVFVAEGTTARVGFGTNMTYPPSTHSGCAPAETFDKPTGEWRLVETDLVARGREGADQVLRHNTVNATGDDVGAYLDRWSLFIYGGDGQRAIVYLDDVRVEGEVPSEADYNAWIAGKWDVAKQRLRERIDSWRAALTKGEEALASVNAPDLQDRVAAARERGQAARDLIDQIEKRGQASSAEVQDIEAGVFALTYAPPTLAAIAKARAAGAPFLLYTPRAITNNRLLPGQPLAAPLGEELSCAACRGEYESVSVVVYAVSALRNLRVSVSDLKGPGGSLPAKAVNVSLVKVWYQAGRGIGDVRGRMLVPELLLKDGALVRVDAQEQQNYLRSTNPDGTTEYLLCSGPDSANLAGVRPIDAEALQPVDIAADSIQQFWLTVQVPDDAQPGEYAGEVTFTLDSGSQSLPLRVTVHPFDLLPSRLIYSIYYRATLAEDGHPTITSEAKSEEQYRAEIADMKAHGVLYPSNYQAWKEPLLERVLQIRDEVGMPPGPFFNLGQGAGSTTDPVQLTNIQDAVRKWIALCGSYGYDPVYFYGIDEATGERLASQRAAWQAVQDAGGKTFVACYKKAFEAMGGLLSCAVLAGPPDPEEARKWHSVGSLAFCYANPQVGCEEPETYRRNFGLVLWKAGFDGAMDYAYQHGFNHVWNDFDSPQYRDHNFTYPTVNGVVDTVQWEGFREAVDDFRYVTTLEAAIAKAPAAKADVAKQAQAWLDNLDPMGDLYATRAQMVGWIAKLK